MTKKPLVEDVPMADLNVEVPLTLMDRVRMAKVVSKKPIRDIVIEAVERWLWEFAPQFGNPEFKPKGKK